MGRNHDRDPAHHELIIKLNLDWKLYINIHLKTIVKHLCYTCSQVPNNCWKIFMLLDNIKVMDSTSMMIWVEDRVIHYQEFPWENIVVRHWEIN